MDLALSDHFCVFFDVHLSRHLQSRFMTNTKGAINENTARLFEHVLSQTSSNIKLCWWLPGQFNPLMTHIMDDTVPPKEKKSHKHTGNTMETWANSQADKEKEHKKSMSENWLQTQHWQPNSQRNAMSIQCRNLQSKAEYKQCPCTICHWRKINKPPLSVCTWALFCRKMWCVCILFYWQNWKVKTEYAMSEFNLVDYQILKETEEISAHPNLHRILYQLASLTLSSVQTYFMAYSICMSLKTAVVDLYLKEQLRFFSTE